MNLLRAHRPIYPRLCPPTSLPEPPAEAPHEAWAAGWWLGIGAGLVCGAGLALVAMFALGKL